MPRGSVSSRMQMRFMRIRRRNRNCEQQWPPSKAHLSKEAVQALARDGAPKACRAHLAMPADQPDADLAASPSDSRLRVDSSGLFSLMGTAGIGAERKSITRSRASG